MGCLIVEEKGIGILGEKLAFGVEPSKFLYYLRLARYQALAEEVAKFVKAQEPKQGEKLNLLDIGVGQGRSMRYIDNIGVSDHIAFFGIDKSVKRLGEIYCPERWVIKEIDLEHDVLPFETASFDIVICEQVLEHLEKNVEDVIDDMARVLKPNGLLIIGVPSFLPLIALGRQIVLWYLEKTSGFTVSHKQSFTCRSFTRKIIKRGGIRIVARRGFRFVSGGKLAKLEDRYAWYKFNRWFGELFPQLCAEIQFVCRKTSQNDESVASIMR